MGDPGELDSGVWNDALQQLHDLEKKTLLRRLVIDGGCEPPGVAVNFSSNDYLSFSHHPTVVAAAQNAAQQYGAGATGSRLISGTTLVHQQLEAAIAAYKGTAAALVFSSGYLASLGLIQVLSRRCDGSKVPVCFDRLSHACIVDAAMATDSPWHSYPHNDVEALRLRLDKLQAQNSGSGPRALVVTEGIFSMDGDLAPLPELLRLCEQYQALLIVDDAHGTGTIGPEGRGAAAHWNLPAHPNLVHLGTLSKGLGSQGGFVAGPDPLIRLLVNRARTFIFDTALAPPCAAAALAALELLQAEPAHLAALQRNMQSMQTRLSETGLVQEPDFSVLTPIFPVILKEPELTLRVAGQLSESGYQCVAVRPPTVPRGTSRLRITVNAGHTKEEIRGFCKLLGELVRK